MRLTAIVIAVVLAVPARSSTRLARSVFRPHAAAPAPRAPARMSTASLADFSSEIDNVPLWVAERPLLPGFQERANVEVCNWWYSHDAPGQIARIASNSSLGTLLHVFTLPDPTAGPDELAVVMQARIRIKVLRVRTRGGLQYADVQLMPDTEEVTAHVDLAVHALSSLPSVGSWLRGARAESVIRSVAHAAAVSTARAWAEYECAVRIGSFKFGATELVRMNRTVDTLETATEAHARARAAAEHAARLANMRWGQPAESPVGWTPDGPAPAVAGGEAAAAAAAASDAAAAAAAAAAAEPTHVVLAANAAARFLASRASGAEGAEAARGAREAGGEGGEGGGGGGGGVRVGASSQSLSLRQSLQASEWALWLAIDSVWFLLSKLSSKRALLLPDEVLQLQPPPPPGGWAHQYCMQQGSPAVVATADWSFDEAYPLARRAQRLSFVASSLMPGAPQQQILEIDGVAERLGFLKSVFERHEMALRSLVALQEIEADGATSSPLDDDTKP